MKRGFIPFLSAISTGGLLFFAGCSKQEQSAPAAAAAAPTPSPAAPAADNTAKAPPAAAAEVKAAAETAAKAEVKAVEAVKPPEVVTPPAPAPAPQVQAAAAQSPVSGVLERVKALVAEKKYPEALTALSELSSASLTTEQQSLVTQLKTQISTAMAAQAGSQGLKSVGGLLNK